jgi:molecular chaperone DnaK
LIKILQFQQKKSQIFSTAEDNQSAVTIRVFQGEREMASDNKLLGQFDLVGIPPAARGMPQIEVTFDIDANGIVNVSAKDKATGKEQQIRIQASGGLSESDIEKMIKEAEENAEADKKKRELIDARNQADGLIHQTEKNVKEHGDKIPKDDKKKIESDLEELKKVKDSEDLEAVKSKTEQLVQSSLKLGEAIYKQNPQGEAPQPDPSGSEPSSDKKDEKVVDADFEEVDEDKKK